VSNILAVVSIALKSRGQVHQNLIK
jgi:hypothetical protein